MTLPDWDNLVFQPALPIPQVVGIGVVLAALACAAYWRLGRSKRRAAMALLAMRLVVIAAICLLLLGPSEAPPDLSESKRPTLTILIDTSRSMLTDDIDNERRIDVLLRDWLGEDQLATLRQQYDVQLVTFDAESRSVAGSSLTRDGQTLARGDRSHVVDALRRAVLTSEPTAIGDETNAGAGHLILLLSDGHDSGDQPLTAAASLAKARGVAIHTATFGSLTERRDLIVEAVLQQPYLIAEEPGTLTVRVHQAGLPDARTTLRVRAASGGNSGGDEQITRRIAMDGRPSVAFDLPIKRDDPGLHEYRVSIDAAEGETELRNNEQVVFVRVTDKRMRVLIVEGEPHWDTKFLAQALRRDASLEVSQVTQVSPTKRELIVTRAGDVNSFELPNTLDALSAYDVIVLGRHVERLIESATAELLTTFVLERGGHVVFARGRPYGTSPAGRALGEALGPIEPVRFAAGRLRDLSLRLAREGRAAPMLRFEALGTPLDEALNRLPGFISMARVTDVKPLASTLLEATTSPPTAPQTMPALVVMPAGRGSVLAVLGDGLHRWSFLAPELDALDGLYDALWSNAVRWLVMGGAFQPGQQVTLDVAPTSTRLGQTVHIDVVARFSPPVGFNPSVRVTPPGASGDVTPQTLTLSPVPGAPLRLRATYEPNVSGVFRVDVDAAPLQPANLTSRFSVSDIDVERLDASARPNEMRALAEATGGLALDAAEAGSFADDLQRLRASQRTPRRAVYIWDQWWVLAGVLIWAGVEWIMRRAGGLL